MLRPASVESVCCFLGAAAFGAVDLIGFEFGRRPARCCRKGDFSGIGGGGVDGGGEVGLPSNGGLGSGGGFGLLAGELAIGLDCIGKAPGTGGGV